jgi:hypothetical protein
MSRYRVRLVRQDSYGVTVEADNEEEALEKAFNEAPYLCAQCSGWGDSNNGCVDASDWEMPEDFYSNFTEEWYGKTVELEEDE